MSLTRKKKAAIAAVTHYLRTEAEAARFSAGDQPAKTVPMDMSAPWTMGGRVHQMQLRSMMQWKAFHGYSRR